MYLEEFLIQFEDCERKMELEPLMWYDFPVMYVDKNREVLLVWYSYGNEEDKEFWFMVKNPIGIKEYIAGRKTLRELLLEGITYFMCYDYKNDKFAILSKLSKNELLESFVLPASDSYYQNKGEKINE